uniref:Uncharacterized protein n=1 Tax=Melanopsichium pennsylvanicum 4 TaxID=1398559 RepID=A0A077QVX0_9BASI|nr:uncharacterized protein BN887_06317 [Melanopsichium pennsylvanicum 4]
MCVQSIRDTSQSRRRRMDTGEEAQVVDGTSKGRHIPRHSVPVLFHVFIGLGARRKLHLNEMQSRLMVFAFINGFWSPLKTGHAHIGVGGFKRFCAIPFWVNLDPQSQPATNQGSARVNTATLKIQVYTAQSVLKAAAAIRP